ncbi:MAG: GGDEF domain-containing protein [Burkholderiaceae bacterium]|nr:GGDEF domain-containing protein [Roseateles sp.]MBV8469868.1 GGDEF domain-containing protein [Burkholderiaceae bacterium]
MDLPTVITYSGLMACIMGLILLFLARSYPAYIKGVRTWAVAPLLASLAVFCRVWLRQLVPDAVAIGSQNVCLIATAGFFLAGTCEFFEVPIHRRFLPLLIIGSALATWMFTGYEGAEIHRRLFARTLLIGLYGRMAWVIYSQPPSWVKRLASGVVTFLVGLILTRALIGYVLPGTDGVDSHEIFQLIYAVGFSSTDVLIPICALLMITERLRLVLEQVAMQDSLTGALTRRAWFDFGEAAMTGCRRRDTPLSLLMLDLDHFKDINDKHGHWVGDQVLRDFVSRTQASLRQPFYMGRYGGEEFAVLLPDTPIDEAAKVAERIRSHRSADTTLPDYSVSIGVATLQADTTSLQALIQRADQSLYRAKQQGRDRVELAEAPAKTALAPGVLMSC